MPACVHVRPRRVLERLALTHALPYCFQRKVVKDCENLRSSLKRHLRSAENLPALWHKKGGRTVGGAGQELPSFPGEADRELQVVILRSLYGAAGALPPRKERHGRQQCGVEDAHRTLRRRCATRRCGVTRLPHTFTKRFCAAAFRTMVNAASAVWDGRRDGREEQENAKEAGVGGEQPPVAAWVCPQARDGRAAKRTKRQSGLSGTFGLDISNTHALMLAAGAAP